MFRLCVYESNDAAHTKLIDGLWLCEVESVVTTKSKKVFYSIASTGGVELHFFNCRCLVYILSIDMMHGRR